MRGVFTVMLYGLFVLCVIVGSVFCMCSCVVFVMFCLILYGLLDCVVYV